ncbi:hypothetical protein BXZ70DRAFT_176988 [Cristinia sonorae]|uniref:F-box domain-containing protein n=1 Tax=Cristinia sonorae TaxID=1940300 RepID=A0A8K0UNU5_9AGAR|nr:hypothetical protein BXZ70DRAFT_176988 [Cristinia sonorae]
MQTDDGPKNTLSEVKAAANELIRTMKGVTSGCRADTPQASSQRSKGESLAVMKRRMEEEMLQSKKNRDQLRTQEQELLQLRAQLEEAFRLAEKQLNETRNAMAYVTHLPRSILLEIFRWASLGPAPQAGRTKNHRTIIAISRTCASWRKTALASPALWATLHLAALSGPEATLHAKNSGEIPLRIYLRLPDIYNYDIVSWKSSSGPRLEFCPVAKQECEHRFGFCEAHLDRISSLSLEYRSNTSVSVPSWVIKGKARKLASLTMTQNGSTTSHQALFQAGPVQRKTATRTKQYYYCFKHVPN